MHKKRILSALVLIPAFVLLVLKGGVLPFILLVLVATLIGMYEFYSLWGHKISSPYKELGLLYGACLCLAFGFIPDKVGLVVTTGLLLVLLWSLGQARHSKKLSPQILLSVGGTLLGLFYVVWLLGHMIWLRQLSLGREAVLFVVFITCCSDTAAYYVGNAFGKHRLAAVISPGKSVEGAIGGLIGCVVGSYIASQWFFPIHVSHAVILGLFLGVAAQLGDLCESLFKRAAEVKDSGSIIPGHGGVLDRLDSLTFTAPCLFYYLTLIKL